MIFKKGCRLSESIHLLNRNTICRNIISKKILSREIIVLPVINSTNQYLLDHIDQLNSGDSCIAEHQQVGRGRRGRKWFSPFGVNLYFSMFWNFQKSSPDTIVGLSPIIGIVVAETLQRLGTQNIQIKWPNDLYLYNRKLGGILVEMVEKTNNIVQTVVGVGINITMHSVQSDIVNQDWTTLQKNGTILNRNTLVACLIKELNNAFILFEKKGIKPFLFRWKKFDYLLNRSIKLVNGDKEIHGVARGINEYGAIMLEQNGTITSFIGEEISLMKKR